MDNVYTPEEIQTILAKGTATHAQALKALDTARRTYETGMSLGAENLSDDYRADLLQQLQAVEDSVVVQLEAVRDNARQIVHQLSEPRLTLTAEEYAEASTRAQFVKEDAESLRPHDLAIQFSAALEANDRPALYLLARYVKSDDPLIRRMVLLSKARITDQTRKPDAARKLFEDAQDVLRGIEKRRRADSGQQYAFQSTADVSW